MNGAAKTRRDFAFAAFVIGVVFIALAAHTWRKWPDILVDFGLQLYCPWRISSGSVLYRDIAYLVAGPISQYYHATLFKCFGVSMMTVVASNLALSALFLGLIYYCFYRISDQLAAITICLATTSTFVFAHNSPLGIFNFITPYCSESVHGLLLSSFAIAFFAQWFEKEKPWSAIGCGLCAGLAFMAKPEVFLALAITLVAGIILFWRNKKRPVLLLRALGIALTAALLPIAGFFIYFTCVAGVKWAGQAIGGGWIAILNTRTSDNPYFKWCLGLDAPEFHLKRMLWQSAGLAAVIGIGALACHRRASKFILILVALGLAAGSTQFNWIECGQCLPVLCLVLLALLLWRNPSGPFPILWTVFSLGMLLKLGLFSRIWHYGFVLGLPAFAAAIYLLLWVLPRELERFQVAPNYFRGLLWLPLVVGLCRITGYSMSAYAMKTVAVGEGGDKFSVYSSKFRLDDTAVIMAMQWMKTNAPPNSTLAVLPNGVMINYLLRLPDPSRYPIWPPPEIAAFGQDKMTGDFEQHSPDYILLLGMDCSGFGEKYFGVEDRFGGELMRWIQAHYVSKYFIGYDWLRTGDFGIRIFQKSRPTAPHG